MPLFIKDHFILHDFKIVTFFQWHILPNSKLYINCLRNTWLICLKPKIIQDLLLNQLEYLLSTFTIWCHKEYTKCQGKMSETIIQKCDDDSKKHRMKELRWFHEKTENSCWIGNEKVILSKQNSKNKLTDRNEHMVMDNEKTNMVLR